MLQRIIAFFISVFLAIGSFLGLPCAKRETDTSGLTDEEMEQALKLLSYKLDANGIFYIEHPRWAECHIYDLSNPEIQLVYGTVHVEFGYGGKDWLVQMWKGRYGLVLLGGEIGVYNRPAGQTAEPYCSALEEEELLLAMDIYQHNFKTGETEYLFTRGPQPDWWLTGFVPGSFYEWNKKSEIIMVADIQFPNEEMLRTFETSFVAAGFTQGSPQHDTPETYTVSGSNLKFCWQYIDQGA